MTAQGASAFPRPVGRPESMRGDLPDVAWKWKMQGFVMWEFRKEPFAFEEEFRLKLAVMGLELGEERPELRGAYCKAYRVLPEGPGVSGEGAAPSRNSLGENAV